MCVRERERYVFLVYIIY